MDDRDFNEACEKLEQKEAERVKDLIMVAFRRTRMERFARRDLNSNLANLELVMDSVIREVDMLEELAALRAKGVEVEG